MSVHNPFDDDPRFNHARKKWGRATMVEPRDHGALYECAICDASWVGPIGDYCEWCHTRYLNAREGERQRLLNPQWLGWDRRYFDLAPIDQRVWEQTRGYGQDFRAKWQRDLFDAVTSSLVTGHESAMALRRYQSWTIHMRKSAS